MKKLRVLFCNSRNTERKRSKSYSINIYRLQINEIAGEIVDLYDIISK